jgi:hypothetical protein
MPARIDLSDELLERAGALVQRLEAVADELLKEKERISVEIVYGTYKMEQNSYGVWHTNPTAEGPVLKYGGDGCEDHDMRCIDDTCYITVSPRGAVLGVMGFEGMDYPIDTKADMLDLPEVYFCDDFIRHLKEPIREFYTTHYEDIIEDMPPEHRSALQKELGCTIEELFAKKEEA